MLMRFHHLSVALLVLILAYSPQALSSEIYRLPDEDLPLRPGQGEFEPYLNCLEALRSARNAPEAREPVVIPASRRGRAGFYYYSKGNSRFFALPEKTQASKVPIQDRDPEQRFILEFSKDERALVRLRAQVAKPVVTRLTTNSPAPSTSQKLLGSDALDQDSRWSIARSVDEEIRGANQNVVEGDQERASKTREALTLCKDSMGSHLRRFAERQLSTLNSRFPTGTTSKRQAVEATTSNPAR